MTKKRKKITGRPPKFGSPMPDRITLRVPLDQLDKIAAATGLTRSEAVRQALMQWQPEIKK
jgi:hypothetical protein